jgi:hypothetical protein
MTSTSPYSSVLSSLILALGSYFSVINSASLAKSKLTKIILTFTAYLFDFEPAAFWGFLGWVKEGVKHGVDHLGV